MIACQKNEFFKLGDKNIALSKEKSAGEYWTRASGPATYNMTAHVAARNSE